MTEIFIVVAALVVFFIFIQKYVLKHDDTKDHAYQKRPSLMTMQEAAFFNALKSAVGHHGAVFAKVSMSNVLAPAKSNSKKNWFIAQGKISRSYFDFVVCDPRTLEVRVIIAFDNGKELNKGKIDREKLLIHVCKSAGLPLIGASVKHSYQVSRLKRLLAAHIDLIEPSKEIRFCKKCGSPMTIKLANQGEHKGRRFFTCSRQPNCTYTENYNVVFEMDDEPS